MSLVKFLKSTEVAVIVTAFCIVTVLGSYYIDEPTIISVGNTVIDLSLTIFAFALCLGLVETTLRNLRTVRSKKPNIDKFYALWTVGITLVMLIFGLMEPLGGHANFLSMFSFSANVAMLYTSLLGFFIITAAIRAFKVRTLEAFVMMITALIMTLKFSPIGAAIFPVIGPIGDWILSVPSNAAARAIMIGIAVGTLAQLVRILSGREKGYLGGK